MQRNVLALSILLLAAIQPAIADVLLKYSFSKSYTWNPNVPQPDDLAYYLVDGDFQANGQLFKYGVNSTAGNYYLQDYKGSQMPTGAIPILTNTQSAFVFGVTQDESVGSAMTTSISFKISGPKDCDWALVYLPYDAPSVLRRGKFINTYPEFDSVVVKTNLPTAGFGIIVYVPQGEYVNVDDLEMQGYLISQADRPPKKLYVNNKGGRTRGGNWVIVGRAPAGAKVFVTSDSWSKDKRVRVKNSDWKLKVRLKPGKNIFSVYTVIKGKRSKPFKVTVTRN